MHICVDVNKNTLLLGKMFFISQTHTHYYVAVRMHATRVSLQFRMGCIRDTAERRFDSDDRPLGSAMG